MKNKIFEEDIAGIIKSPFPWNLLAGKTILISGANGFLATFLVETLLSLNLEKLKKKCKVIALVRDKEKAKEKFGDYFKRNDLQFLVQDVCLPIKFDGEVDFIIHAASFASPKYYGANPVETLLPNILGTKNLLDLAREKKSSGFLFFSSGEIYGEVPSKFIPIKENNYGYLDPVNSRSCYAESKRMGETLCLAYYKQYGVPIKIVRPFHTYGPGMKLDDGRVHADFVANILRNQDLVLQSDGRAVRSFCYLADATAGFFTVLLKGQNGEAYNVGNDKGEISILNLAKLLISLYPEKNLRIKKNQPVVGNYLKSPITRHCPDITKIKKLGWQPKYSLKEGFKRMIESYL